MATPDTAARYSSDNPVRSLRGRRPDAREVKAVGCRSRSHGCSDTLNIHDHLPSGMSFFDVADGLRYLAQRVTPLDDGFDCPSFDEVLEHKQIRLARRH